MRQSRVRPTSTDFRRLMPCAASALSKTTRSSSTRRTYGGRVGAGGAVVEIAQRGERGAAEAVAVIESR
jgi:hypothetical protein